MWDHESNLISDLDYQQYIKNLKKEYCDEKLLKEVALVHSKINNYLDLNKRNNVVINNQQLIYNHNSNNVNSYDNIGKSSNESKNSLGSFRNFN